MIQKLRLPSTFSKGDNFDHKLYDELPNRSSFNQYMENFINGDSQAFMSGIVNQYKNFLNCNELSCKTNSLQQSDSSLLVDPRFAEFVDQSTL